MVSHLVYRRIDVPLRVVGTAKTEVDDPFEILLAMPAAQLRFYLLTLVGSQVELFQSAQNLRGSASTLATSICI
jgi:hypothetical protein